MKLNQIIHGTVSEYSTYVNKTLGFGLNEKNQGQALNFV